MSGNPETSETNQASDRSNAELVNQNISRRVTLAIIGGSVLTGAVGGVTAARNSEHETPAGNVPPGSKGMSQVRVGHLSPDTPAVDVYVGRGTVDTTGTDPTIGGLSYQNFAPNPNGDYVSLRPGRYNVKVTPEDTPETVAIEANPDLTPETGYTILAVGELSPEDTTFSENDESPLQPLPLVDFDARGNGDEDDWEDEKAKARFVHASPDAETVDIVVKEGPTIASGVNFGDSTGYLELDPGEYTIQIKKGTTVALEVTVTLKAGDKVSAYVVGNALPDEDDEDVEGETGAGGETVGNLNALITVDGKASDYD